MPAPEFCQLQGERIKQLDERSVVQGQALERLEEQSITVLKCMRKMETHIVGNTKPGILTRLALLEGKQKLLWWFFSVIAVTGIGVFVKHIVSG